MNALITEALRSGMSEAELRRLMQLPVSELCDALEHLTAEMVAESQSEADLQLQAEIRAFEAELAERQIREQKRREAEELAQKQALIRAILTEKRRQLDDEAEERAQQSAQETALDDWFNQTNAPANNASNEFPFC